MKKLDVLYIDDYELDRELVKDSLEKEHGGFEVTEAAGKERFESLLKTREFDVVLSDFNIAGFEGLQVLETTHAHDPRMPVIIVTGTGSEEIAVKAMKQGASGYVIKRPKHILRLPQTILAAMEKRALRNQREKAEVKLEESEKKFRVLYHSSPDMYASISAGNAGILECNETLLRKTGYSREEIIGFPIFKMYHDDCMDDVKKAFQQFVETGVIQNKELILKRKDGSKIDVSLNVNPVRDETGKILQSISSWRDATERKRIEKALRKSEEKYRSIFENAVEGFFQSTPEGHFISVNPAFAKMFGYGSPDELISSISDIAKQYYVNSEDRLRYQQLLEKDGFVEHFEFKARCKDGSKIWVSNCTRAIYDQDGKLARYEGNVNDISLIKKAEEERERLISAIEQVTEAVVITDSEGTIQYVNPAFELITGYTREEAVGRNPRILKSGEHDNAFYRQVWQTITSGDTWRGTLINKKKDGTFYTEEASISPVFDGKGEVVNFVAVKRDITEDLKMEEKLRQAQKMESIGTLASGIAHDFNNILFSVIGYTEMALDDLDPNSRNYKSLQEVLRASARATGLVKQILTFSRQSDQEFKPVKIDSIVSEALKLLRASLPSFIEIRENIATDPGVVMANPSQIHQVVMNLCTNAHHAMMDKDGILEITLRSMDLEDEKSKSEHPDLKPGSYLCLTVSDTGTGIPSEIRGRIFDPYFTTKDKDKGTGLGLSVVQGIVRIHGGQITVDTTIGKGTIFTVFLPLVERSADHEETESPGSILTGNEHILIVDDEEPIVIVLQRLLENLGYQITVRTSSVETLEAFRANPQGYDLLITDMTMPNMTGDQLAIEIKKVRPDMPVILCTGFSEKITQEKASAMGIDAFLMKPVDRYTLAKGIRKVLDPHTENADVQTGKILIIDDDDQLRKILRQTLEKQGYTIAEAADGLEGVTLFRREKMDLVITDLLMPNKEGIETIIELKREFPEIKIIAISGGGSGPENHYLDLAKKLGAQHVFPKPIDKQKLLMAVRELLAGPE